MPLRATKSGNPGFVDNSRPNCAGLSSLPGSTGLGNAMHCIMTPPWPAARLPAIRADQDLDNGASVLPPRWKSPLNRGAVSHYRRPGMQNLTHAYDAGRPTGVAFDQRAAGVRAAL